MWLHTRFPLFVNGFNFFQPAGRLVSDTDVTSFSSRAEVQTAVVCSVCELLQLKHSNRYMNLFLSNVNFFSPHFFLKYIFLLFLDVFSFSAKDLFFPQFFIFFLLKNFFP